MTWVHVKPNSGMGLTEQWILRVRNAPVCSLKRDKEAGRDAWQASLLNLSGISCVVLHVRAASLQQAQADSEAELRAMGWSWGRPQSEEASTPA